jgi:hypothetical protein
MLSALCACLVALPQLAEERSSISTRMEKREGIAFMNVWGSGIRIEE